MNGQNPEHAVNGWNAEYIDTLYRQWRADPASVDPGMRSFFQGFDLGVRDGSVSGDDVLPKQPLVDDLVNAYRSNGHLKANLDPLGLRERDDPALALEANGLSESDLDEPFDPGRLPLQHPTTLRAIIEHLEATYCRHVGVEFMHIRDAGPRHWLQERMESVRNQPPLAKDQRLRVLRELAEADAFESFLNLRYRGKKRFSLEGAESLNAMLNEIIDYAPGHKVAEFTIGMAHRGRINVLVNILQKTYDQLFTEFEESWVEDFLEGGGDVKYHKGYSSDHVTPSGDIVRLTLSPNPSHLEFGHSVVLGRARAKQRLRNDTDREECVPILIHGDAAFPGQGIVAEMFNFSQLPGYTVGGAVHIVVNNQVGFTTNQDDLFSGTYCTDIAKMIDAPIFHVNGDDPEACVFAAMLALEYRQRFHRDVVVDMWCFRKFGHNEGDEPRFTQPEMYRRVDKQQPVYHQYVKRLVDEGVATQAEVDAMYAELRAKLDESQTRVKETPVETDVGAFRNVWAGLKEEYTDGPCSTGVDRDTLLKVGDALGRVEDGFNLHRKLQRLFTYRGNAVRENEPIDWGLGEMLAYGTLLLEGHAVRLTGQDCERGTFSHRHAVVFDQETGASYTPLNNIDADQGRYCIYNSPLTESACVGFEYGYSLGDPQMLVLWEAQFGDFANGAQVIIDQFIASSEIKWKRFSGLTLLLPHGYEGQGPEHSSARLERFLLLCANDNMQVVYPTTPAQMFHVLRRQMKRSFRKPLVIMSPKSLLRHPRAISHADEFVNDRFHHLLDDPTAPDPAKVKRLILCTGKVYYDLETHREMTDRDDVAIVRVEQLFPLRSESIEPLLKKYTNAELVWVQEEPKNMGAWLRVDATFRDRFDMTLEYIGRSPNASPAVASTKMHEREQLGIMVAALGEATTDASPRGRRPKITTG